jgi:hypothetical protein
VEVVDADSEGSIHRRAMTIAPDDTLWAPFQVGDAEDSFHSRAQVHFATYRRRSRLAPSQARRFLPPGVGQGLEKECGEARKALRHRHNLHLRVDDAAAERHDERAWEAADAPQALTTTITR